MSRLNFKDMLLSGLTVAMAVFMVFELVEMRGSVAGTIGPGVYPAIVLGLVIVSGLFVFLKSLSTVRLRLILPFSSGGLQGLMIAKLPGILARGFEDRVQVKAAVGQGFFSARHLAAKAKPDGATFAVISGEQPSPSCFYNASLNLKEYEPAALLAFDPYVFVARAGGDEDFAAGLAPDGFLKRLSAGAVGFSFQEQVAEFLVRSLSHRTRIEFEPVFPASTKIMLQSLESGGMSLGLCPMSDLINNKEFGKACRLLAVGGPERLPDHPEAPTLQELGVDIVWGVWMGLALPAGTPPETTQKVWSLISVEETMQALRDDIRHNGGVDHIRGADEFRRLLEEQSRVGLETEANRGAEQYTKTASLAKVAATVAFFASFLILAPFTGFLPSSMAFLATLSILLWPSNRKRALPLLLAVSVGVSLGIYWIFSQVFSVVFP